MLQDLEAAASEAWYLANTVSTIRALPPGHKLYNLLYSELCARYQGATAAIDAVERELRQARECRAARFGDIVATTACQAAVEMVYALNRERQSVWVKGKPYRFEIAGRKPVVEWPDVTEICAEIELERAHAEALRKIAQDQKVTPIETLAKEVEWSKPDLPSHWAKVFNASLPAFLGMVDKGTIRCRKLTTKSYMIAVADLPAIEQPKHRPGKNSTAK